MAVGAAGKAAPVLCLLALVVGCREGRAQTGSLRAGALVAPTTRLANEHEIRKRLGLVPEYQDFAGIEAVKVAVLDYGFDGVGSGRAYLPADTVLVEDYDPQFVRRSNLGDPDYKKPLEPLNIHGRIMAQIIWAVTGNHPAGPRFFLLNASGPTMLRRAVRYAVEQKVDVILFSGSFEGGGNGDGRGPINAIVDEALGANILWINAAGNYGRRVFNAPVKVLPDGYLRLRNGSDVAALRFRNHIDENAVTITLTWSDYRAEEDAGTDKDLDLYVEDWAGRRIGAGEKQQVSGSRIAGPDESRNPRERVVLTNLPASPVVGADPDYTYRIRVRARKGALTAADQIRILLTAARDYYLAPGAGGPSEAVEFLDATGAGELYPPADHPLVLTVGDAAPDSAIGPTADRRIKPDVILEDSRTYFSDGLVSAGSSNAAAYVAGVVALLKAAEPGLRMRHLLLLAHQGPAIARPSAASSSPALAKRSQGLRIWQTPSRARLAATVREGR
jgi:subtilisin family serine protease